MTIHKNLMKLHRYLKSNITLDKVRGVANARQGWYGRANLPIINFLITPEVLVLPNKKENRPGLIDPLSYSRKKGRYSPLIINFYLCFLNSAFP